LGVSVHLPAPSHVETWDSMPPVHAYAPQGVVDVGYVHEARWTPSHRGPQSVPTPVPVQAPCEGAPRTAVQVPTFPVRLQASHWPVQAESQHTRPAAHAAPLAFLGTHAPPTQ
jgi:hypothetical protein